MKPLTVRLPDDLHEQLRRLAFDERVSMNELVIKALLATITKKGRP
jgi:predicted HicB family RNase H-like nuclease